MLNRHSSFLFSFDPYGKGLGGIHTISPRVIRIGFIETVRWPPVTL